MVIQVEFKNISHKDVQATVFDYITDGTFSVVNIVAVPSGGYLFLLGAP